MKTQKIIHIYCRAYDSHFPSKDSPYYYLAGWSSLQARSTIRYTDKYTVEIWRSEKEITTVVDKEIEGVKCRLFPLSNQGIKNILPITLLRELYREANTNCILINLHQIHNRNSYIIAYLFRNFPIVSHHHGEVPPIYRKATKLLHATVHNVKFILEKMVLKWIDCFSVISKVEKEYLEKIVDSDRIILEAGRVLFNGWKPIDKKEARAKLGIAENKKVIMYVGKYYKLKGVDVLLEIYENLKRKYNLELILIGGSSSDPLYRSVKLAGARDFGRLPHHELPLYYSAADVYLAPALEGTWVSFGGLSTAVIEALACNIPVVTTQLIHFPTNEWRKVGQIPKDRDDVVKCVSEILENPSSYRNCRSIAKKYYDLEKISRRTIKIYDMLFDKYYS